MNKLLGAFLLSLFVIVTLQAAWHSGAVTCPECGAHAVNPTYIPNDYPTDDAARWSWHCDDCGADYQGHPGLGER